MQNFSLILLLLGTTLPCFQSQAPEFGPDAEAKLIKILKDAKGMKWNEQIEKGMETIIEDEEKGVDPEKEDETVRDEITLAYKRLLMLDPSTEMTLKDDFRAILGDEKAQQVFDEAERIMWKELQEQAKIDKELAFKNSETKAFHKLVKDVETGKDPLNEHKRIKSHIIADASKILSLSPEEQTEEKDRFLAAYGQDTGEKVFEAIQIIHQEADKKAAATKEAQSELHQQPAGTK